RGVTLKNMSTPFLLPCQRNGVVFIVRAYLWRISLVVMTALAGVLVFVADGAGALQFTLEVGFDRGAGIAGRADYDLDAALVKYLDGAAAHAAGYDDLYALVGQEVRQEARPVARIG